MAVEKIIESMHHHLTCDNYFANHSGNFSVQLDQAFAKLFLKIEDNFLNLRPDAVEETRARHEELRTLHFRFLRCEREG
jgi:hypothetical protein